MHRLFFLVAFVICSLSPAASAQTASLRGLVKDKISSPLVSVKLALKGTKYGTLTDRSGAYSFADVPAGAYTLVASLAGFETVNKDVIFVAGEVQELNLELRDKVTTFRNVEVLAMRTGNGMGHLREIDGAIIYAGKKNEVILLDSLNANTVQNSTRQVLGRIPGINISETEGSGFPSNGVGFRGFVPTQSVETNTRQNGYNVAADIYGYPEAYYLPPLEAVERIEVTRGASSLQFGPQFGGVINYVTKRGAADKDIDITAQQTLGSFGLFNSFTSVGGTVDKVNYFAYLQYTSVDGWRPNSGMTRFTGFAHVQYQASDDFKLGLEYSILRNTIRMPGGLNDSQYTDNVRQSLRSRNWLQSPWNILTATLDWKLAPNTIFSVKSAYLFSARDLVWRNEDGGPGALDVIDPATNDYIPREVQRESFTSSTTEARLLSNYALFGMENTVAAGVRFFAGSMKRQGGGPGSTGADFDLNLYGGDYEYDLSFTTMNTAVFVENIFRLTDAWTLTPGFRYEYINSTVQGYVTDGDNAAVINSHRSKNRSFALFGVGTQIKTSVSTNFYGNISQAYRPIDYTTLTPFSSISKIDPTMKDANGFNADAGWRGTLNGVVSFDVGGFYVAYNNRVGLVSLTDANGDTYTYRTNVANSVHKGIEAYLELDITRLFVGNRTEALPIGSFTIFNSYCYTDARYTTGEFSGNRVEYAPEFINRVGMTYALGGFGITAQYSMRGKSFGDANNTVTSDDAVVGVIPAYNLLDVSATVRFGLNSQYNLKAGVTNLADTRYFTLRTDEYPGPGIIPGIGRSFYISLGARF